MAALAGGWTALTAGFAGVRIVGDTLAIAPVPIPGVGSFTVRVRFRGRQIDVSCTAGGDAQLVLRSGEPLTVINHGRASTLVRAAPETPRE
jgi:alpha,alpha-trehalose phosphorylase